MDVSTAFKTARNNAAQRCHSDAHHYQSLKAAARWAHMSGYVRKTLAQYGFKTVKAHDASLAEARAAFVAACKIEVIAL